MSAVYSGHCRWQAASCQEGSLTISRMDLKVLISVLNLFREESYARILGIFIILSVVSAFFIQYSFLAVTRVRFPAGEDMASFLGVFTGSIMILTLLGKLLLFSYLLKITDLKSALQFHLSCSLFLQLQQLHLDWGWDIQLKQPADL